MEVTLETGSGRRVVDDVVDCQRDGNQYRMRLNDGTALTVRGFIVGLTTMWRDVGYGMPAFNNVAVELSTEGRLDVPIRPLANGTTVDDEEWTYEDGFDFGRPEVEPRNGVCVLRNVSSFMEDRAVCRPDADVNSLFKSNAGDNAVRYSGNGSSASSGTYRASFSSGWLSVPLTGTIERATAYRESRRVEQMAPTSDTYSDVSWAFE